MNVTIEHELKGSNWGSWGRRSRLVDGLNENDGYEMVGVLWSNSDGYTVFNGGNDISLSGLSQMG